MLRNALETTKENLQYDIVVASKQAADRDDLEATQQQCKDECPKFGNEWERFEEQFAETEVCKQKSDLTYTNTSDKDMGDHSPKFGTDWEQFHDDTGTIHKLNTAIGLTEETLESDIVNEPPRFGDEWEQFEGHLQKTDKPDEDNKWRTSERENSFEDFARSRSRLRSVSLQGIYLVNTKEDKYVCEITDICQLSEDVLVLTDIRNKMVKRLGKNYDLNGYLKLSDAPFGVCKIDSAQVAVTLMTRKKVQCISSKKKMTLKKSFFVRDCCRGITFHGGLLYICCGGSASHEKEGTEGLGHLAVYSLNGTYLSKYSKGISSPRHVCINNDCTRIFITDIFNSIIVLDMDGRLLSQINHEERSCPSGICRLSNALFCVTYHEKNEVWSFDENGHSKEILLKREAGLAAPRAVYYDSERARLLVSSVWGDDTIRAFHLRFTVK